MIKGSLSRESPIIAQNQENELVKDLIRQTNHGVQERSGAKKKLTKTLVLKVELQNLRKNSLVATKPLQ